MSNLLILFVVLKITKLLFEHYLSVLNKKWYEDPLKQKDACEQLQISQESFAKTLLYTKDKESFQTLSSLVNSGAFLLFLTLGGFTFVENMSRSITKDLNPNSISTGLVFFLIIGVISTICSLPFDYYSIFKIEEKHGFNKQNFKTFVGDNLKSFFIGIFLGGLFLASILYVMNLGSNWWIWAWMFLGIFSILTSWIYPTLLAPLFNKFSPIEDGELKDKIFTLAKKVNFKTSGLYVMDASTRSSHGNAYFTGVFGKKRIVLFDTLLKDLNADEVVSVLAHELGHFKLNHVRWGLVRGFLLTGLNFYLLSLCLPLESFYTAFGFSGVSNYAALIVFSLWFGLVNFLLSPFLTGISRKNEFAADKFASEQIQTSKHLSSALLKLRESNHSMPISHPYYSTMYYSHPPLLERLKALN